MIVNWKDRGLRPAAVGLGALALLIIAYLVFAPGDSDGSGTTEESAASESAQRSSASAEPTSSDPAEPTSSSDPSVTTSQPSPTDAVAVPTEPEASAQPSASGEPYAPGATSTPPGFKNLVHIAIAEYNAAAQTIEVSAGAPGIATDAGICNLSAVNGAATLTMQQPAEFDGHGASCGLMSLSITGQPTGPWQVSVSFTSPQGDAVSEPQTVEVT